MKKITGVIIFLLVQTLMYAQVGDSNLILNLPFNGSALDETGNLNNGSVYGPQLTTYRFGQDNSAYYFDGIDDYISIENNTLNPSSSLTFSFWFSPSEDWDDKTSHKIFFQSDGAGDNSGDFIITMNRTNCYSFPSTDDGKVNFELQGDFVNGNSANCPSLGTTRVSSIMNTWEENEWYNISLVLDKGEMKIYVNGNIKNVQQTTSKVFIKGQTIVLGRYFSPQHLSLFKVKIDDVQIYDTVLSESEILYLYTGSTANDKTASLDLDFKV